MVQQPRLNISIAKSNEKRSIQTAIHSSLSYISSNDLERGQSCRNIGKLSKKYAQEMEQHIERWYYPSSIASWNIEVNALIEFVQNRSQYYEEHLHLLELTYE